LTARLTTEYGADYFGIDYDQTIYHWIESNYRIAGEFGHFRRDHNNTFAALLYHRRDPVERIIGFYATRRATAAWRIFSSAPPIA